MKKISHCMGIDVQIERGCAYFVVDQSADCVDAGWAKGGSLNETANRLHEIASNLLDGHQESVAIGIDSPRVPLSSRREYYWDGRRHSWRQRRPDEKGHGRHCEIVLKALKIANPQWTRMRPDCPKWMELGFQIFEVLKDFRFVFEVFPSASFGVLREDRSVKVNLTFAGFSRGPKDMLDACVGAMTVFEFVHGRGVEVGGGDGFGSIILPRPLVNVRNPEVLEWPTDEEPF